MQNLDAIRAPIHYANELSLWGEAFGWDNIDAAVFDRQNFHNGSLIEDFCIRAAITYDAARLTVSTTEANTSPSYGYLAALRNINRFRLGGGRRRRMAERAIQAIVPNLEFPKRYDALVLSKVSDGNRWLNDTFFSDLPVKLPVAD
ncbi:hypothetical protein [Rhodovulum sp. 12E13]|uniref:hypothetical protein n=1 Tax=Rhodovulum sp. 12E13 TaxID=2203891 RepID=UPI0011C0790D|nr:hypothetical protein [Rhodovulum sp. 12E13]